MFFFPPMLQLSLSKAEIFWPYRRLDFVSMIWINKSGSNIYQTFCFFSGVVRFNDYNLFLIFLDFKLGHYSIKLRVIRYWSWSANGELTVPFSKQLTIFQPHLFLSSANVFNLDQSNVLSFGRELINQCSKDKKIVIVVNWLTLGYEDTCLRKFLLHNRLSVTEKNFRVSTSCSSTSSLYFKCLKVL